MLGHTYSRRLRAPPPLCKLLVSKALDVKRGIAQPRKGCITCKVTLKEETARHLVRAVRAVHAGRRYFTKRLEAESGFVLDHSPDTDCKSPIESLSERESEIVPLVAAGHSSSRIARELGLTTTTVETYRRRILQKLGVSNVAALTKFAVEHGFTPPA